MAICAAVTGVFYYACLLLNLSVGILKKNLCSLEFSESIFLVMLVSLVGYSKNPFFFFFDCFPIRGMCLNDLKTKKKQKINQKKGGGGVCS